MRAVVAHLQQAVDHAEPERHRPADAAQQLAGLGVHAPRMSAAAHRSARRASAYASQGMPASSSRAWARASAAQQRRWRERRADRRLHSRERPMGSVPRIVVRTTTWRQTCSLASRSEPPELQESASPCRPRFPQLMLEPRAPAARCRRRCARRTFGIWQTLTWCATRRAGAPARVRPGRGRPEARRAPRGDRREPPAPVRVDAGGAVAGRDPGAALPGRGGAEFVFPIHNAEIAFAIVEDQEQVDKLLEIRRSARSSRASGTTIRAACATTASRACARSTALLDAGRACDASHPGFFDAEIAKASARRRGGDVLHLGHDRQRQGRGAHASHPDRPRRAPARRSTG